MHHFFVEQENIHDTRITVTDSADLNHALRVLRLKPGERVLVSDPGGRDYICSIAETGENGIAAGSLELIIEERPESNHELPAKIILFQCLPKSDKMELIIQKSVELGVSEIVPVTSRNCVMKLDPKKASSKTARWQTIAENAAVQSKRSRIPQVREAVTFREAVEQCAACDISLIPYESEDGMAGLAESVISFLPGRSIGVIIGPEGGFDPLEVSMARRHGIRAVSLGKRILRCETAALAMLSLVMIRLEIAAELGFDTEEL